MQQRKETLMVLLSTLLVLAYRFQRGSGVAQVQGSSASRRQATPLVQLVVVQITDGENGFLVSTVDQAAERMVQLLRDPQLRRRLGHHANERCAKKS
jgi:hypothetical protein